MMTLSEPIALFVLYAQEDKFWFQKLEKHLALLQRQGLISIGHQQQIVPGADRSKKADEQLEHASIILLLISTNFLASNSCQAKMDRALERHHSDQARVIPIALRPTDSKNTPFFHLQWLPTNGKAIMSWRNQDQAFLDIVEGLRRVIETLPPYAAPGSRVIPPIWNVPYGHNDVFTGQKKLLEQIATRLKASKATPLAISGLSGTGKTQVALEYAYRHQQDYQAILWVDADTRESLISGYVEIAHQLNLPQKNEDRNLIVKAVTRWFQVQARWLLILDNADELAMVRDFLPSTFDGHILLTTCAQSTGRLAERIEVGTMDVDGGALLLLRRAGLIASKASLEFASSSDVIVAREITQALGGLPLALDQAGAYIEETQSSLSEYQALYSMHRTALFKERGGLVRDHPDTVTTTWSLSFEKVGRQNAAATDLLHLCACLSPDAIPEDIIIKGAKHLGPLLQSIAEDPLALRKVFTTLRAYSLINRQADNQTINIHRLVQAVLRDSMSPPVRKEWEQRAMLAVNAAYPDIQHKEQWQVFERWLPHALACAAWVKQERITSPEAAFLLNAEGYYLHDRTRYKEAEQLFEQALSICEKQLGPEHPNTATILDNLAHIYYHLGKYEEAEPLYRHALAIREQLTNPRHSDTTNRLSPLAHFYEHQGKDEQVAFLYLPTLAIKEQKGGPEHPDTATSLNNLGTLYCRQGKYEEAKPLFQRVLKICEQQLGPEHLDTATILNSLGILYTELREYQEAESFLQRARSICERQGSLYPDTATVLNNLAELYSAWGRYEEAEPLYQQALTIRQDILGPEHLNTATSLNNLARFYKMQEKYEKAEQLYQHSLAIREAVLGPEHSDTVTSLNNLAALCEAKKMYEEAGLLYQRVLAIREKKLGLQHLDTAQSLKNLATLYRTQGRYEQARSFYQRSLLIYEHILSREHSFTQKVRKSYDSLLQLMEHNLEENS